MKKCPICNEIIIPSFEHIPPQSTGNNTPVFISNENTFNTDSKFYKRRIKSNKGFGLNDFCQNCNIHFGTKYVTAFSSFIKEFRNLDFSQKENTLNVKPLNIIKSVYANCLAANYNSSNIPKDFADYVLKEKENDKFYNYRVFINRQDKKFYRLQGWHMEIDRKIIFLARINFPGIEIIVTIDASNIEFRGMEITQFNKYIYDQTVQIKLHSR